MATSDDQAYVAACATLLGMALDDEQRQAVAAAFAGYRESAALLMSFALPVETEPASVYTLEDVDARK